MFIVDLRIISRLVLSFVFITTCICLWAACSVVCIVLHSNTYTQVLSVCFDVTVQIRILVLIQSKKRRKLKFVALPPRTQTAEVQCQPVATKSCPASFLVAGTRWAQQRASWRGTRGPGGSGAVHHHDSRGHTSGGVRGSE